MSCMYLSKDHYQYTANAINRLRIIQEKFHFHRTIEMFGGQSQSCESFEQAILTFIQALQLHNDLAYDRRYPRQANEDPIDFVQSIAPIGDKFSIAQLLKCLECIDYQCIDNPTYEISRECKELRIIVTECKNALIYEVPAYQQSQWSL